MRCLLGMAWVMAVVITGKLSGAGGDDRSLSVRDVNRATSAVMEDKFVPIGGIDQWISIRGENSANPVIVVLHGGPAEAQTPLEELYVGWEKEFTVVQWDQRGAGKTFGRNPKPTPDMTLDRMVQDGVEVVDYVRKHLGKEKVIVLGHSWGSFLGVNMVKKRPDLFCAYVGTGQVVGQTQGMAAQYAYAMRRAEAEGNREALKELREIGLPPHDTASKSRTASKWLRHYLPDSDAKYIQKEMDIVRSAPNFSNQDVQDWIEGQQFSASQLFPILVAEDLPATQGYNMPVPFFVIQGLEDEITPTSVAQAYFQKIRAPRKKIVLIQGAGHFAYATNGEEFLAALVKFVRPIAVEAVTERK